MNGDENQDAQLLRSGQSWALQQSDTGAVYPVLSPSLTIGRCPDNDLVLQVPSSSNFHAVMSQVDGIWYLTDRNSSNGTLVNQVRITPRCPHPLHVGDRLKFTKAFEPAPEFIIILQPDEPQSPSPRPFSAPTQHVASPSDSIADADQGSPHHQHSDSDVSVPVSDQAKDSDVDSSDSVVEIAAPSPKRPCIAESRPNLSKVDDYRCVICGELPLAMAGEESDLDLVYVLSCHHHFHRGCINIWLQTRSHDPTCPSCRSRVDRVEPVFLIHQHAALLRQERRYEIDSQGGDQSACDIEGCVAAFLDSFRKFRIKRSRPEKSLFDTEGLSGFIITGGKTLLGRLSRLKANPQKMLLAIGDVLRGCFDSDSDLAALYDSDSVPGALRDLLGQIVNLFVQTALSYDVPIDPQPLRRLLQDVLLPESLRAILDASLRSWSDPSLKACLSGNTDAVSCLEPELVARNRFGILLAQGLKSDAANYANSQQLRVEACVTWAQLRHGDRIISSGNIPHLSWADRAQILKAFQDLVHPSQDLVFRFTQAVFDVDFSAITVSPTDVSHVMALLTAYVRSSARNQLKGSISRCADFLSHVMDFQLMCGLLEQLSATNPTASPFLACKLAAVLTPQIQSRCLDRLDMSSLLAADSHDDDLSFDRLLQLIVTTVSSHGDLQQQKSLGDILFKIRLRPKLVLSLTKTLMKIGSRGESLAWRLLQSTDLSRFTSNEITQISNVVQQLEAGSIANPTDSPEFFIALFKLRPSRSNFNRLHADSVRSEAVEWVRSIPPSEQSLESVSLLLDNANDSQMIANIIGDCVLDAAFAFGEDPIFYCHLLANPSIQSWLEKVPSVSGTKIITTCGRLLTTNVLFGDSKSQSGLAKVIDDVPDGLSARIYESACRMALEQYCEGKIATKSKRHLIRTWIQRLRSLCLVSNDKSRWTGFQNSSMRSLKPNDPLVRELRTAGLFNAVV